MAIVQYTAKHLKRMKSKTDWQKIKNMKDEDIDLSDIPEITDAQIALASRRGKPLKTAISIRIPAETAFQLRNSGKGWQTKLSAKIAQWAKSL